jgi:hypothetical protein
LLDVISLEVAVPEYLKMEVDPAGIIAEVVILGEIRAVWDVSAFNELIGEFVPVERYCAAEGRQDTDEACNGD